MEFRITPFEDALESGLFEKLCIEAYGESIMPLWLWPDYMMEVFEGARRVFFCSYWSKKRQAQIITTGIFGEVKDRMRYFNRVVNYLHEVGHDEVYIEILYSRDEQIAGVMESGFEPFGTRMEEACKMLQFIHTPGGRGARESIKGHAPLRDPVEEASRGLTGIH